MVAILLSLGVVQAQGRLTCPHYAVNITIPTIAQSVIIQAAPQQANEGSSYSLSCVVCNESLIESDISFQWIQNDSMISKSANGQDANLTFNQLHLNDSGEYMCEVKFNSTVSLNATHNITVIRKLLNLVFLRW